MAQVKSDPVGWLVSALLGGAVISGAQLLGLASIGRSWTVDSALLSLAQAGIVYAGLLMLLHLAMLAARQTSGALYAIGGGVMLLGTYALLGSAELNQLAASRSSLSLIALGIAVPGMLAGLLYRSMAGLRTSPVDPDMLADWLGLKPENYASFDPTARAVLKTPAGQFYAGPTQVRSSFGIMFLSCAVPYLAIGLCGMLLAMLAQAAAKDLMLEATRKWDEAGDIFFTVPASPFIAAMALASLMILITVQAALGSAIHRICRALDIRSAGAYGLAGFVGTFATAMIVTPLFLVGPFMLVSMVLYRKWAGLEPKGLPEPVHVSDPATLIAPDHPARHYHQVIDAA